MTTLIPMSPKEVKKLDIVHALHARRLTQREAAELLGVSDRAVRSWQRLYKADGARGLVHGNRGRRSPRKMSAPERRRIVTLLRTQFPDFGPTLAAENLGNTTASVTTRRPSGPSWSRSGSGSRGACGGAGSCPPTGSGGSGVPIAESSSSSTARTTTGSRAGVGLAKCVSWPPSTMRRGETGSFHFPQRRKFTTR